MKTTRVFAGVAALIIVCSGAAMVGTAAQSKSASDSVAGNWSIKVTGTPHGDLNMALTLKQKDDKLTGTFASPHGDLPVEGQFVKGELSLATTAEPNITFKGRLQDDGTLAGYLSSERGDMTFTATRTKGTE